MSALIVVLASCSLKDRKLENDVEHFLGTVISIPEYQMQRFGSGGIDSLDRANGRYQMVVYTDSTECSPCAIKHLNNWESIIDTLESFPLYKGTVFIFSPSKSSYEEVNEELRKTNIKYSMYLDTCNVFLNKNRGIPSNGRMHTFLIDDNNRVALIGNPLTNEKIRTMYYELLGGNFSTEDAKGFFESVK